MDNIHNAYAASLCSFCPFSFLLFHVIQEITPPTSRQPLQLLLSPSSFLFLLIQIIISPHILNDPGIAQLQSSIQIRSQIGSAGLPSFRHGSINQDLKVDLSNLRVSVMPEIAGPGLAFDHDKFLQFYGELNEDNGRNEPFLVQKGVEVAGKALEFGPVFDVFDEVDVGVVAPVASDADVEIWVEVIDTRASHVVHVLLHLVGSLSGEGG